MFGFDKFAAKFVSGKGLPNSYESMNLGVGRIVQGEHNLCRIIHFEKGLFPGFKPDAVAGDVYDRTGVLLFVLDKNPFKTDFLSENLPPF